MLVNSKILLDEGKGKAQIALVEKNSHFVEKLKKICVQLASDSRIALIELPELTQDNWQSLAQEFQQHLLNLKIRIYGLIATEEAASFAKYIYLANSKVVRSLVLIDATTRSHLSLSEKIAKKVEKKLPMGLPLKKNSKEFDSRPFLHRIRCPVLVAKTDLASQFVSDQIELLLSGLPTAWGCNLLADLGNLPYQISQFNKAPLKCPQKNK